LWVARPQLLLCNMKVERIIFVILVISTCASDASIFQRLRGRLPTNSKNIHNSKRQSNPSECQSGTCSFSLPCLDLQNPCGNCETNLDSCLQAFISNNTALCSCFSAFFKCSNGTQCLGIVGIPTFQKSCSETCTNCAACTENLVAPASISFRPFDTSYCDVSSCVALKPPGASCTEDTQCGFSLIDPLSNGSPQCMGSNSNGTATGTCIVTGTVGVGDSCTNDYDCDGNSDNNYVTCKGGVCVGPSAGGQCNDETECTYGYYCSNRTCQLQIQLGGTCDPSSAPQTDQCVLGLACGVQGKCIEANSLSSGGLCYYSNDEDWSGNGDCGYDLYCAADGKCASYPPTPTPCQNNTDCPSGLCACNYYSSNAQYECSTNDNAMPSICKPYADSLLTCLQTNKCKSSLSINPNTCAEKNCKSENECALQCFLQNSQIYVEAGEIGCASYPQLSCAALTGPLTTGTGSQTGSQTGSASGTSSGHNNNTANSLSCPPWFLFMFSFSVCLCIKVGLV